MRRLAALIVPFLLAAVGLGPAAAAHGAEAAVSVGATFVEANGVRYIVRVVYQNDGEPVPNATLTAVAIGPDGTESPPVTFSKTETVGEYMGFVPLAAVGASSVRFTTVQPDGGLTITDQETNATTTTAAPTDAPPTTATPATTAAPTTSPAPTTAAASTSADADGGSPGGAVVIAALVAALVMAVVVVTTRRRRG